VTRDSATGNAKLFEWELEIAKDLWLDSLPCMSHLNFIGLGTSAAAVAQESFLLNSFCTAKFLNASTHLLRCSLVADRYLKVEVRHGEQSWFDKDFAAEVQSYLLRWDGLEAAAAKIKQANRASKRMSPLRKALERFFAVVHGGYSFESESFISYTSMPITDVLKRDRQREASAATVGLLFTRAVPEPSASKWTKFGPAADYHIKAIFENEKNKAASHKITQNK
jgi:hypothetical protein